jgi:hypothetical protein
MPISNEIAEDMIGSPTPGAVRVYVGPCTVSAFKGKKIPLDGRRYACDGRVFLRSGHELRAKFSVDTTDFDFIDLKSVVLFHNSLWYRWDDEALFKALGTTKDAALPFTWVPDRPLDYHEHGPYPMRFEGDA